MVLYLNNFAVRLFSMKYFITILGTLLLFTSCQKELTYDVLPGDNGGTDTTGTGGTDTTGNTNYTYYYDATIDGKHYFQDVTDVNGYEAGSTLAGVDDVTIGAGINPEGGSVLGKTGMGVTKGTLHGYITATDDDFKNFFAPGDYPFSVGAENGVVIGWLDESGTEWDSDKGTADQTGSSFKIVSQSVAQTVINLYLTVRVQFNCKLYDDSGHVRTVTNATFVGAFGKI